MNVPAHTDIYGDSPQATQRAWRKGEQNLVVSVNPARSHRAGLIRTKEHLGLSISIIRSRVKTGSVYPRVTRPVLILTV